MGCVTTQYICSHIYFHWTHNVHVCLEEAHKLTQFTLSALKPYCAVANKGVPVVHTRAAILAGETATVLRQL